MTYSLQSHEAAVVRHPMPKLTGPDPHGVFGDLQNQVLRDRTDFATNIDGASDHTGEPPLLIAITQVSSQIKELEAARRRLIAFGRHGVTGTPYSYVSLGTAAGRSDVWAKEAATDPTAKTEALTAQDELRPQPAADTDPELAAMARLERLIKGQPPQTQAAILTNDHTLRRMREQNLSAYPVDDAAWDRAVAWVRGKYATTNTKEA